VNSILTYNDYRAFLRDYYNEKKEKSASYSFRFFARKAGLRSPNYLKLVMDGERNLTHRNIRKFALGLGLGDREQLYFENLVFFTQAKDPADREFFKKNLETIRAKDDRTLLTRDQYEIFALWYPAAIREALLIPGFPTTPKKLAARFDHSFTPQQAREALDLLLRIGMIETDKTGGLRVTKQSIQTPDLTKSEALVRFYHSMIEMAQRAVEGQSSKERCLSGVTVAVRKEDLKEAFRRIHEFRNEMNAFFSKGKAYDAVYQLNLQLFRLDCDGE
jgi:uncharacterized protein (TIGR02147 family)